MFAYGLRDTELNGEAAINPIIQYKIKKLKN